MPVRSQIAITQRKRLGQFFSGARLARLLATIADAKGARIVIDPMCGNGDMLKACYGPGSKSLV
jgi:tRNA G10  N-methylase Trm11